MSYHTVERKFRSMCGMKRPLYSGSRVYRTLRDVQKRISWLEREWGEENVYHERDSGDPMTELVYIRID